MALGSNPFLLNYYLYAFGFPTYPFQVCPLCVCHGEISSSLFFVITGGSHRNGAPVS